MRERNSSALSVDFDGSDLETANRELAFNQVRTINDTLRKVRRLSRQEVVSLEDVRPTDPAPPMTSEEVMPSKSDSRREREDSTEDILIPEPVRESRTSMVFRRVLELFEQECSQYNISRPASPVVRRWKLY